MIILGRGPPSKIGKVKRTPGKISAEEGCASSLYSRKVQRMHTGLITHVVVGSTPAPATKIC